MSDAPLNVRRSDHAEFAYKTLGSEDKTRIETWFRYLRNWRTDPALRTQFSKCLDPAEGIYSITTSTDYVIVFKITGDEAVILSILNKDMVRAFETAGRSAQ